MPFRSVSTPRKTKDLLVHQSRRRVYTTSAARDRAFSDADDAHITRGSTGFGVRLLLDLLAAFRKPTP